jgi:hypothetical protein
MLGHSTLEMTRRYANLVAARLVECPMFHFIPII